MDIKHKMSNASVVIAGYARTNATHSTHYAIALRYSQKELNASSAPILVAKGTDELAIVIKEIAKERGIQIIENPPLARKLYRAININQAITESSYAAIVAVLLEVARLEALNGKNTMLRIIKAAIQKAKKTR